MTAAHLVGDGGSVLAFEPVPATYRKLQRNVALNGTRNVITENLALGNEDAELEISIRTRSGVAGHRYWA